MTGYVPAVTSRWQQPLVIVLGFAYHLWVPLLSRAGLSTPGTLRDASFHR